MVDNIGDVMFHWLNGGKFRSIVHRHDDTWVAADESDRRFVHVGSAVELASMLNVWPVITEPLPPAKWIKVEG